MKVVQFRNGKYGVRRGIPLFDRYLDMDDGSYWWHGPQGVERWASTESEMIARAWLNKIRKSRWPDWGKSV